LKSRKETSSTANEKKGHPLKQCPKTTRAEGSEKDPAARKRAHRVYREGDPGKAQETKKPLA